MTIKAVFVKDEGKEFIVSKGNQQIPCLEIRAAAVAPTVAYPGYYLCFARRKLENPALMFLSEGQADFQSDLFLRLLEDARRLMCHTVYVEPKRVGFMRDLHRLLKDSNIEVKPSLPYLFDENLEQGIVQIRESAKRLDIPKGTIVADQLGKITPENISDEFYALKALNYLVTWFERYPGTDLIETFRKNREEAQEKEMRVKLDSTSKAAWDELDQIRREAEEEEGYVLV